MRRRFGLVLCFGVLLSGAPLEIHSGPRNIGFVEGAVGQMPVGWQLGSTSEVTNHARVVEGSVCYSHGRCAEVQSLGLEPRSLSYLYQTVDATPYRGKRLVYRAAVRAVLLEGSVVRLQVHTHHPDGTTSVRDDMGNHPVKAGPWSFYEIDAAIASDARDIMFGVQVIGGGTAWIDQISLTADDAVYGTGDEAVRAVVTRFADARNAHDANAVGATYAEDAEYVNSGFRTKGRAALAQLWGGLNGQAQRLIRSVDFVSPNVAVVHVSAEFTDPVSMLEESFVVVRGKVGWVIQLHEAWKR